MLGHWIELELTWSYELNLNQPVPMYFWVSQDRSRDAVFCRWARHSWPSASSGRVWFVQENSSEWCSCTAARSAGRPDSSRSPTGECLPWRAISTRTSPADAHDEETLVKRNLNKSTKLIKKINKRAVLRYWLSQSTIKQNAQNSEVNVAIIVEIIRRITFRSLNIMTPYSVPGLYINVVFSTWHNLLLM